MTIETPFFIPDASRGFRFSRQGELLWLESLALAEQGGVVHAFCTRRGGVSAGPFHSLNFSVSVGDDAICVERNREIVSAAFGIPAAHFVTLNQVHGDDIAVIEGGTPGDPPQRSCDGLLSVESGSVLCIKTADCVPVLLADTRRRGIGAVHAGWKGTARGIAGKAVRLMAARFGTRPADIIAVIGPAIGRCCYEVDEPVRQEMRDVPGWREMCVPSVREGRWMCDLPGANRRQLAAAGVPEEHIHDAGLCTACHREVFFSHRGEGEPTGRQLNFIMRR